MNFFFHFLIVFDVLGLLHRARAARQAALLSLLAIATEKQLPLTPILDAFADDSRFGWRHQVHDLSDMLQSGTSLADALESVPGLLPPDAVMAARVGSESGTLAAALKMAAQRLTPRETATVSSPSSIIIYLAFVSVVMLVVVSFIMVYIIPKFQKIFADFGVELPPMTLFVIDASHFAATYGLVLIPFLFAGLWVAMVYATAAGRPTIPMTGPFKILAIMVPRIATGGILRSLSIAVAAGRPIIGVLSTMAGVHPAHTIRRRIATVADSVEQGHDCWQALLEVGLVSRREAALLSSAERAGNLDWALRRTADNVDSRISFRFNALVEFVRPVLMLVYAGIVGVVVVGLFMPIVKLLSDLS